MDLFLIIVKFISFSIITSLIKILESFNIVGKITYKTDIPHCKGIRILSSWLYVRFRYKCVKT